MAAPPHVLSTSPLHGLDRRSLGFLEVWAQSVAAAAPSAAAASVPVMVFVAAGQASVWAVGLAVMLAFLISSTIGQFARRMAGAGSLYAFVARGLGAGGAVLAGTSLCIGYLFVAMFTLGQAGEYLTQSLSAVLPSLPHSSVLVAVVVAAMGLACYLVLSRGIRISTRLTLLIELVSIGAVVVLLCFVLAIVPIERWGAALLPGTNIGGIAAGGVAAMTAFVGFESAVSLGAETRRRLVAVPRAVRRTVPLVGGVLLLSAFVQVVGFDAAGIDPTGTSPVTALAGAFDVPALGVVLDLTIAASFLACAIASTTALVRVLLSMAREGLLPEYLGRTHQRFRTPHRAITAVLPAIVGVPVIFAAAGLHTWQASAPLMTCSVLGYMTAYFLVGVSAPVFLRRLGEATIPNTLVAAATAILVVGCVIFYVATQLANGAAIGVVIFIVTLTAGLVWCRLRIRRRPWVSARLGMYEEALESDLLEAPESSGRSLDAVPLATRSRSDTKQRNSIRRSPSAGPEGDQFGD